MKKIVLAVLALVMLVMLMAASLSYAQVPPVKNPTSIEFLSADHALATGYEVDIINNGNVVIATLVTGKGTQAADGTVTLPLNVQPIAFGTYTSRVRTVAGSAKSATSVSSDPWERGPQATGKPVVK